MSASTGDIGGLHLEPESPTAHAAAYAHKKRRVASPKPTRLPFWLMLRALSQAIGAFFILRAYLSLMCCYKVISFFI